MTEEPMSDAYDTDEPAQEPVDAVEDELEEPEQAPPADEAPADEAPASTGHPAVDEVLRSLDALGDAPVDEHVAVFEQAHDQLRRTLQGAGDNEE